MSKAEFEQYLNGVPVPADDQRELGGRIPAGAKYGTWLRRNDPIAFQVACNESN